MTTTHGEPRKASAEALRNATRTASKPLFFGPSRELFGFYHAPAGERRAGAVVLCPAHGWDYEASYRSIGHLAERLSLRGFAVLRFDYHGTGNSSGADHDPDRLDAWEKSVEAAIAEVRALGGETSVSVFGLRLGGLIAARAVARVADVASLVLWAPCVVGKAYVREMRAMRAINPDESVARGDKIAGGEEAGGFMLSASTVASLTAVNLTKTAPTASRYLLLGRDDLPDASSAFLAHLTTAGVDVEHVVPPGYRAMMLDPLESAIPDAAIDVILEYLERAHPVASAPGATSRDSIEPSTSHVRGDSTLPEVRERAVRFAGESQLFGVLTEPPHGRERPRGERVGLVFLNTGAIPHMGPHRVYVPFVRELAAAGYVSLRFDLEGFGDSPPREGKPPEDAYSSRSTVNARAAIDYLRAEHGVDRIAMLGMCSGAYHTFHTALADDRITMAVLLRPQVFSWEKGEALDRERHENYADFRYYASRLTEPDAWRKLARADVRFDVIAKTIAKRARTLARDRVTSAIARARRAPKETPLAKRFRSILERGSALVLVYSKQDPGLDHLGVQLGEHLAEIRKHPRFHFVLMDGSDFTFAAIWSQDRVKEAIRELLRERFGA